MHAVLFLYGILETTPMNRISYFISATGCISHISLEGGGAQALRRCTVRCQHIHELSSLDGRGIVRVQLMKVRY